MIDYRWEEADVEAHAPYWLEDEPPTREDAIGLDPTPWPAEQYTTDEERLAAWAEYQRLGWIPADWTPGGRAP